MVDSIDERQRIATVQRRIGFIGFGVGLVACVGNLYTGLAVRGIGFWEELASIYILPVLLGSLAFLVSGLVFSAITRWLQCLLFFAISAIAMFMTSSSSFGIMIYILGILLLFQYGFFKKGFLRKIIAIIVAFICLNLFFVLSDTSDSGSFAPAINYLGFFFGFLLVTWLIFSDQIGDYIRKNRELEETATRSQPFVNLGQNVGGLVHNLRNDILLITNSLYFLQKNENAPKDQLEDLRQSVRQLSGRIDRIMFITKDRKEAELLDVNELVRAVTELFLCVAEFKKQVKIELDLHDSLFVFGEKAELRQVLENLIKNAWEAVVATGRYGSIKIGTRKVADAAEIAVEDAGNGIPACHECGKQNCLECDNFKIGRTTKAGGTGYGMVYVMKTVKKYRGSLDIDSENEKGTKIVLRVRGLEHEEKNSAHRRFEVVPDANGKVISV